MVHAVDVSFSDIQFDTDSFSINNVVSETGLAFGLSTWYDSKIKFREDVDFNIVNIKAGSRYLDEPKAENAARFKAPNYKPLGCGIRIHESNMYRVSFEYGGDDSIFNQQCILGVHGCEEDTKGSTAGSKGKQFPYTHIGKVNNKECQDIRMPDFGNVNGENDEEEELMVAVNGEEDIMAKIEYFGNVFIMMVVSLFAVGLCAVYYFCLCADDDKKTKKDPNNSKWNVSAYGSF